MARSEVTRRDALTLGAAAGAVVLLGDAPMALARPRSFSLSAPVGTVVRPGRRFDLVGVSGADASALGLQLRTRRTGGAWSRWAVVGSGASHAPDGARPRRVSDPVFTGGADEVQLRTVRRRPSGPLRLAFVSAPVAARDRVVRARAAQTGAPPIITRAEWGARAGKADPSYGEVQMAFVHHTESTNDYTAEQSASLVRGFQAYHQDHNGWNDIGYNFLVDRFGQVFEGRAGGIDQPVIGAQAEGWNSHSTGVATIGSFMKVGFPDAAADVLAHLLAWKLKLHGVPATGTVRLTSGGGSSNRYKYGTLVDMERISGHRDGCSTDCPGDVLYASLDTLRARVASLQGTIVTRPRLSLLAEAARVTYGSDARFSGKLLGADGVPVSATRVSLQKQGSSGWVTMGATTTGDDGAWSLGLPWKRDGSVRARASVRGVSGDITSSALSVDVVTVLGVSSPAPRSRVHAGESVKVRGVVRPGGPVTLVVERQARDGRWKRTQAPAAKVNGQSFSLAVRLRTPGLYRISARADGVKADAIYVRAVRSAADVGAFAADA